MRVPLRRALAGGRGEGLTVLLFLAAALLLFVGAGPSPRPPAREVRLAFLGDEGSGSRDQRELRDQLALRAPRFVFLLGDNVYSTGAASLFDRVMDGMYKDVRLRGSEFHAALGNHDVRPCSLSSARPLPADARAYSFDDPGCDVELQLADPAFGYRGRRRYYSVATDASDKPLAEVFVLDSDTLAIGGSKLPDGDDRAQLEWWDKAMKLSRARWKIVIMHHPPESPSAWGYSLGLGGHEREVRLSQQLEPFLREHHVDAVFAGHNHFYARLLPRDGVRYFVSGGGGAVVYNFSFAPGYVARGGAFHHFVYVRLTDDAFAYYVIDDQGRSRDAGWFGKGDDKDTELPAGSLPPALPGGTS